MKKITLIPSFISRKLKVAKRKAVFIFVIVLFIVANIAISFLSVRFDFSFGKSYTLSSSTKKVLSQLKDTVELKLYTSTDLPSRLMPLKTDVVDLLNEYKQTNGGKVVVRILDTKIDKQAEKEAQDANIPSMQFSQAESDKFSVSSAPFGIIITSGTNKNVISQVGDVGGLEYNITSSLIKLSQQVPTKVAVMTQADSESALAQASAYLEEVLGKQFEVVRPETTATTESSLNSEVKTLLVIDSRTGLFSDDQVSKIKNYLDNKGTVLFFLDGVWVKDDLTSGPANHKLFSILSDYGITLQSNLLLSANAQIINFGNAQQSLPFRYPFWLLANTTGTKSSYFTNTTQAMFPWASSLEVGKMDGYETAELLKTSLLSWEQRKDFTLNPQTITEPSKKDLKQFTLVAQSKKNDGGTIIVFPSSRFLLDRYQGNTGDNLEAAFNMINAYASNGLLTGISQRSVNFYPMPDLDASQKDVFKYGVMLTLPILFGIAGALRLMRRK